MLKKITCVIMLAFYIILQPIGGSTSCVAQSSQNFQQQCIDKGKVFLEEYYKAINTQTKMDLPNYDIETDVAEYLDCKQEIMVNRLERSNCNVTYSNVNVECDDYEVSNDEATVIFGKEAKNILNKKKEQENKFYDKYHKTSNNYKKKLLASSNAKLSSISNESEVSLLSITSSARSNIVTYAKNNCSKTTPNSGNSSYATYYDFHLISGAYDCTNFASHCMLAGGAAENPSTWYYNSLSDRTASWSGVNQFYDFIVNNSGNGPQAEKRSLAYGCPSSYINWSNGDIIQLQYPDYGYPGFGHTTIITGSYSANSYSNTPRVTSRTGANWYTKNEVLTVQYPISDDILAYRLLHLTDI